MATQSTLSLWPLKWVSRETGAGAAGVAAVEVEVILAGLFCRRMRLLRVNCVQCASLRDALRCVRRTMRHCVARAGDLIYLVRTGLRRNVPALSVHCNQSVLMGDVLDELLGEKVC